MNTHQKEHQGGDEGTNTHWETSRISIARIRITDLALRSAWASVRPAPRWKRNELGRRNLIHFKERKYDGELNALRAEGANLASSSPKRGSTHSMNN